MKSFNEVMKIRDEPKKKTVKKNVFRIQKANEEKMERLIQILLSFRNLKNG